MRLTLRAMLGYLDNVLDPADAEDVGRKIEESEFATVLLQRTRDVVRRLRLSAPRVDGRGMGQDANSVAEYLDHTLPPERVPDFEKVCLESDVHLAELASAHQILSLVLREPADVDAGMRRRMYQLIDPAAGQTAGGGVKIAASDRRSRRGKRSSKKSRRPQVPDYLRDQVNTRRQHRLVLFGAAATLLLAAILGAALTPSIRNMLTGTLVAEAPTGGDVADAKRRADSESQPTGGDDRAGNDQRAGGVAGGPPVPADTASNGDSTSNGAPLQLPGADAARPMIDAAAPTPPDPDAIVSDQPGEPMAEPAGIPGVNGPPNGAAGSEPLAAPALARLTTAEQALLRYDPQMPNWFRVSDVDSLLPGDRLAALPSYRPTITFEVGGRVAMQLLGGTIAMLGQVDELGAPEVELIQGRAVLSSPSTPGAQVRLAVGGQFGVVTLTDADAALAVEVRRVLPDGANPETRAAEVFVTFYVPSGEVRWNEAASGREELLKAPGRLVLAPAAGPADAAASTEIPAWVSERQNDPTKADIALAAELPVDEPALLRLRELAFRDRRVEVRTLAARSLALLDDFDAFDATISDEAVLRMTNTWYVQVDAIREAMARGPATAEALRVTLERQRGDDKGGQLYELLWGFSPEQWADPALGQRLVAGLDHDDVDIRALSFWNLFNKTRVTHYYRPEAPAPRRQAPIRVWKQDLDSGRLSGADPRRK